MKLSKMAATAGLTMTLPAFAWSQHDHSKGYNPCLWGLTLNNADSFLRPEALEPFGSKRVEAYKGGSAVRFGGNNLGCAINLASKTGADAGKVENWNDPLLCRRAS